MLWNIGSNWALALLQIAVLTQLTPIQVTALGPPAQGAWLTIEYGAGAFSVVAPRWVALVPLLAAGIGMVALFGAVWILFVYRDDPYFDPFAKVARFLPRALQRKAP